VISASSVTKLLIAAAAPVYKTSAGISGQIRSARSRAEYTGASTWSARVLHHNAAIDHRMLRRPRVNEALPPAISSEDAPARPASFSARLRPWLPWLSLGVGVAGAVFMDRGPKRAAITAAAALALWLTLLAMHGVARVDAAAAGPRARWVIAAVRRSSLLATQSLVQLTLFFALPFYYRAASAYVGHVAFMIALCAVSAASLWDPLTEWLFTRPLLAPLLPAMGSFAALTALLPGLGLSTRTSLWIGASAATAGVVLLAALAAPSARRGHVVLLALGSALLLPLALRLGAARVVPAAPLRLVAIEFGTRIADHALLDPADRFASAPPRLYCATAIASPVGVRDRLFHVWTHDGAPLARIELDVRGGRGAGFRTFSRVKLREGRARGDYRCSVETAAGQVLGERVARVGAR
jgi:hypothetical protein